MRVCTEIIKTSLAYSSRRTAHPQYLSEFKASPATQAETVSPCSESDNCSCRPDNVLADQMWPGGRTSATPGLKNIDQMGSNGKAIMIVGSF